MSFQHFHIFNISDSYEYTKSQQSIPENKWMTACTSAEKWMNNEKKNIYVYIYEISGFFRL